jgi:hypothetical protein
MALGSTQPLTEMTTRNISWGVKAAGAYGWQPTTFMCRLSRNLGASGPAQACNGTALPFFLCSVVDHERFSVFRADHWVEKSDHPRPNGYSTDGVATGPQVSEYVKQSFNVFT